MRGADGGKGVGPGEGGWYKNGTWHFMARYNVRITSPVELAGPIHHGGD